ncbi:MAG: STAS domain-containing protein [Oscillochloris sp.]|nr:STAS domain-containing protein [Oscillochloris sp.]
MGELLPSYSQLPESLLSILRISSLTGTVAFTLFLLAQFNERVQDLVARMRLINTTLEQRNTDLETQSQTLYEQLRNEQRLMAQVAALEAPIVTIARGMLFAPIVGHLDAQRARALQGKLAHEVYAQKATSIIIDLTGVIDVEDSEIFELIRMIQTIKLLGCKVIVSGISANLAQRLTELQIVIGHYAQIKHNPHAALEAAGINQQVLC